MTDLYNAVDNGDFDQVQALLDNTPDIDKEQRGGEKGNTPLLLAIANDRTDLAMLLLERGADANAKNENGLTALHVAADKGNMEVVQHLVEQANVDVNQKTNKGSTVVDLAVKQGNMEVARYLITKGCNEVTKLSAKKALLRRGAQDGSVEMVACALDNGADVNDDNDEASKLTSLLIATKEGHTEVVNLLLRRKADVQLKDADGWSPLHWAAERGFAEIAEDLIKHKAKMDSVLKGDYINPFHLAAMHNRLEVVKVMQQRGADVSAIAKGGESVLHFAAQNGHLEIVEYLVGCGIEKNPRTRDAYTPMISAAINGHFNVVSFFVRGFQYPEEVNANDRTGRNAIHWAAEKGYLDIAQEMIAHGCDVNLAMHNGLTPLDVAIEFNNQDIIDLLKQHGAKTSD